VRSGGAAARHGACDDDPQTDVPVADALGFPLHMETAGLVPLYKYHRRRHEAMYDEVPHRHGPGDVQRVPVVPLYKYTSTTVPTYKTPALHWQTCLLYWTSWKSFKAVTAHARPAR
jgi:hypothetical protein